MKSEFDLLPRWKCHKIVRAAKIFKLSLSPSVVDPGAMNHAVLTLSSEMNPLFMAVSAAWLERFDPKEGGYFVVYEDGYQSFSPAKAFEDGYTLLPDEVISVQQKVILTPDGQIKQFEITQYPEGCVQLTKEQALSLANEIRGRFA